ncbi:MAG: histidine kinase N-terminal 7TM domain-containing protein [Roseovarius sp.]
MGLETASPALECKIAWSLAAWPAIALLPIAWAFFIFDYTLNSAAPRHRFRLLCYIGIPALVGAGAFTNPLHGLLYPPGATLVSLGNTTAAVYPHGPLFFTIAAGLYIFVLSALGVLAYALVKADHNIKPFLMVLVLITAAPLSANAGYVLADFSLMGLDPTPFMFSAALIAFSWLLANNRLMDTQALGRDLLFYGTQDPVIILDAQCRFAGANQAARVIFGNAMPRQGDDLNHVRKLGPMLNSLATRGAFDVSEPVSFGRHVFEPRVARIASPIQTKGNWLGWSLVFVDITERERSADALREAVVRAEAANEAKTEFLAVISHELRTPLTSLRGGLDLVLGGVFGEVSEPVSNVLDTARKNSVRLQKLIDDILDLQKLDLNVMALDFEDVAIGEFLEQTVEETAGYAANVTLSCIVAPEMRDARVRADPARLKQVVGNVLSNAIKFSPANAQVTSTVAGVGGMARISIRDEGAGIPPNSEEKVFGRFTQVDGSTTRVAGGSGLGLHIARLLVERHDGRISYESRVGEGTVFHIDLPLKSLGARDTAEAQEPAPG